MLPLNTCCSLCCLFSAAAAASVGDAPYTI
jgi:hypothetical protein